MKRLKMFREAAGLSQSQLATAAGVSLRVIHAYEAENAAGRDINKAEAITVYKLANALKCDYADILELGDGTGNM